MSRVMMIHQNAVSASQRHAGITIRSLIVKRLEVRKNNRISKHFIFVDV